MKKAELSGRVDDFSADLFVRILAGTVVVLLRIFSPQPSAGRLQFAKDFAVWLLIGAAVYLLLDPIADVEWISDEAIEVIAQGLTVLVQAWVLALAAMLARRAHDCGLSAGWVLLLAAPPANLLLVLAAFLVPGKAANESNQICV